jgi:outer membrane protein OmpA-like peptidoglycan-associated protein
MKMVSSVHPWCRALCLLAISALMGCQTPPPAPAPVTSEARVATLKSMGFVPNQDAWELSLGVKLLFDTDVDSLSVAGQSALQQVARTLSTIGIDKIRVEGHTDNVGSPRYNDALSIRRAESVAQHLVKAGLAERTIERKGFGADRPVADNATPAGRAQNRRVVITVHAD